MTAFSLPPALGRLTRAANHFPSLPLLPAPGLSTTQGQGPQPGTPLASSERENLSSSLAWTLPLLEGPKLSHRRPLWSTAMLWAGSGTSPVPMSRGAAGQEPRGEKFCCSRKGLRPPCALPELLASPEDSRKGGRVSGCPLQAGRLSPCGRCTPGPRIPAHFLLRPAWTL